MNALTTQHKQILTLFAVGELPEEEIAWRIGVNPAGIGAAIGDLYERLGVLNRPDALLEAERLCGFNARQAEVAG